MFHCAGALASSGWPNSARDGDLLIFSASNQAAGLPPEVKVERVTTSTYSDRSRPQTPISDVRRWAGLADGEDHNP